MRKGYKMRGLPWVILPIVLALVGIWVPACDLLSEEEGPTLQVMSPQDFARVQVGESVDVVCTATDPRGVTRAELYVGEQLYRTDGSPTPEGETSWTFTQTWTPTAAGSYTLTVVAYNVEGVGSTPWAVAVEVVEGPITGGTPISTVLPATGTPPPAATGTSPSGGTVAPPPPTATLAPPPSTATLAPPPATGTAPPPAPTATTAPPTPTNTPPPTVDLYIDHLEIEPEQPHVGEDVDWGVGVRNAGNGPSRWFRVTVTVLPSTWVASVSVQEPLIPGALWTAGWHRPFTSSGSVTIRAEVFPDPADQDSNDENNTYELQVNVLPEVLPDLYISEVSLNPTSPQVGQVIEVSVSVVNGGDVTAGPFGVTWKSDPDTISCSWRVQDLVPGETGHLTCPYTYTYPHPGQSTYAKADANGDVDESDEDNNVRYLRVNVRPAS